MSLFDWIVALVLLYACTIGLLYLFVTVYTLMQRDGDTFDWYRDDE